MRFDRVVIAGVGLIGGSLGLALRERGLAGEIVGYGRGQANLDVALERGAVDRASRDAAEAGKGATLAVLCAPVASLARVAAELAPHLAPEAVVTDAGSVKGPVVDELEPLFPAPRAFVGAHPIAGTESSGAAAAFATLFEGERCILTPTAATSPAALVIVRDLWAGVGMRVESMAPTEHDRLLGLVSHLPHLAAWGVVAALAGETVGGRDPLAYAGGGLRDTTRIAGSHPEMWRDIFLSNRSEVLAALDGLDRGLARLRDLVAREDGTGLEAELERLREARRRVPPPRAAKGAA